MSSITCPTCSAVLPELTDHGVTRCTACQSLLLVANGKIVRSARATDTQLPAMEAPTRVGRTKREPAPARPPAPLSPTHQQEAARAVRLSNPSIPVLPSVPVVAAPPPRPPAVTAMRGSLPASNAKRSEPQSVVVPLKSLEPEQPEATVREPVPELKPLFASDKSGPVATKAPAPVTTTASAPKAAPRMTQQLGATPTEPERTPKPTVVKPVASSELVKAVMEDEHTWVDEPIPAGLTTTPPPKPAAVEKSFAEALAEHDESPVVGVRPMPKPPGAPKSATAAQKTVVAAPAPSLPATPPSSAGTAAPKTVVAAPAPSLPAAAPPSSAGTAAPKTVVAAPAPLLVESPPESRPALTATSLPTTPSPFKAGESTGTPTPEPDQLDMTARVRNPRRMAIFAGGGLVAAALLVGVLVVRHRAPAPIATTTTTAAPTTTAPTEAKPTEAKPTEAKPTEVAAAPTPPPDTKPSAPNAAPAPNKPTTAAATTATTTTTTKPSTTATTSRPAAAISAPTRTVAAPAAPTTTAPAPTRVAAADPAPPVDRPVRVAPKRNHRKVVLEYDKAPAPAATAPDSEVDEAQVASARSAYQRGNQLLFAGNAKGAVDSYKESLRVYPGYVAGYRGLGLAYSALGDNGEARSAFGTYIRTVPNAKDVPLLKKRLEKLR